MIRRSPKGSTSVKISDLPGASEDKDDVSDVVREELAEDTIEADKETGESEESMRGVADGVEGGATEPSTLGVGVFSPALGVAEGVEGGAIEPSTLGVGLSPTLGVAAGVDVGVGGTCSSESVNECAESTSVRGVDAGVGGIIVVLGVEGGAGGTLDFPWTGDIGRNNRKAPPFSGFQSALK